MTFGHCKDHSSRRLGPSVLRPPFAFALVLAATLAGCSGDRMAGFEIPGSSPSPAPSSAAPINMSGRWLLSSPGRGQCGMSFGAAGPDAPDGTIAPEGGCPGKFFTSRKWTIDASGRLTLRDHNGQPLAQLSAADAGFSGRSSSGEPVSLMR